MKKVISASIFNGKGTKNQHGFYWACLVHFVRGYLTIFPDWEVWIYHDSTLYSNFYGSVLLTLEEKGLVNLIYVRENEILCKGMLWRMSPIFDDSVDYVVCRDVDHVPSGREHAIVDAYIASGKTALGMNDAWAHTIPLMGGMIGFKAKEMKKKFQANSLDELLDKHKKRFTFEKHGSDQHFLMNVVWPIVKSDIFMFSSNKRTDLKLYSGVHVRDSIPIESVPEVSDVLLNGSKDFANFMGTPSNKNQWDYVQFIDAHGNPDTIKTIQEAEAKAFVEVRVDCRWAFINSAINKKKVILSCNFNKDYLFYLPIVTLLWQKYTGFKPIVYLIGGAKRWLDHKALEKFVVKESRKLGAEINFVPYISEYKETTIAQLSRIYAACSAVYPDSYFLTSDVDMLPLSRDWFNQQQEGKSVDIKCPNCGVKSYPICYVGASSAIWREFMNLKLDTEVSIENQMEAQLKADLKAGGDSFVEWCYDEALLSRKITAWNGYPNSCNILIRKGGPPVDRVDRSCWPKNITDISKFVDCHSLRPGHTDENWSRVRQLLALKLSADDLSLVGQYRQNFVKELK